MNFMFLFLILGYVFWDISHKYFFLFYLKNRFHFYFMQERILIMILISFEKIIQRYCFYSFLGTLSKDNTLIFTLEIVLKSYSYFILKKILFIIDLGKYAFHNLSIFKNNIQRYCFYLFGNTIYRYYLDFSLKEKYILQKDFCPSRMKNLLFTKTLISSVVIFHN